MAACDLQRIVYRLIVYRRELSLQYDHRAISAVLLPLTEFCPVPCGDCGTISTTFVAGDGAEP